MIINIIRWIAVLAIAFAAGKLMTKIKMPSILGWLIVGMILGPHAVNLMPQIVLDARWYKTIIMWMQCAFVFGGIALATAPAPALSIANEFHAKGPVTDTLLPMTILDDVVGIAVFFTVNSLVARMASSGTIPLYMIPVMIS